MTDVWKSNARKFCEICKVWFADNRVSIEHHEGGQKHKAAVQAKLRELGKQSKLKEKEQKDLKATLAMMESAASKSMGISESCPSAGIVGPMPKPKKYMDPRAHSASIAEMARQMAQRRKEQELERTKAEHESESGMSDAEGETVWVEAKAENGASYYFHMYSGATVWERPKNYYTAEQYAIKLALMENASDAINNNQVTEPDKLKPEPRRHWGQQETSSVNKVPKTAHNSSQGKIGKAIPEKRKTEVVSNVQNSSTCQSAIKTEVCESSNGDPQNIKFDPEADAANFVIPECDIPLPPSSQVSKIQLQNSEREKLTVEMAVKEEPLEGSNSNQINEEDHSNVVEESTSIKNETVERITEATVERKDLPKSGPYGPWVPVEKVPEKPKVDWELPNEEQGRKRVSEPILAPEDFIAFGDKSAPIKRKKVDGPVEFRKRKTTMKIRQPIDEQ